MVAEAVAAAQWTYQMAPPHSANVETATPPQQQSHSSLQNTVTHNSILAPIPSQKNIHKSGANAQLTTDEDEDCESSFDDVRKADPHSKTSSTERPSTPNSPKPKVFFHNPNIIFFILFSFFIVFLSFRF